MKIVVASDSFKGSLSSREVAQAAMRGIQKVLPECEVVAVNVADGSTAWRTKEHKVRETIGLSEDNKIVF